MATHSDVKVVAVVLADVLDEIDGVVKTSFGGNPLLGTTRRITTKSENVAAARLFGVLTNKEAEGQSRRQ